MAVYLECDIDSALFDTELSADQEVTRFFSDDIPPPVKATVVDAHGPGGGNPIIRLEFADQDHAWEWFSGCYMQDDPMVAEEFEMHLS